MQNCSKLLTANTSKPYISSTPMWAWLGPDPTNEALTPPTMLWKSAAYKCLASPSLALKACEGWRGGGEGRGGEGHVKLVLATVIKAGIQQQQSFS